MKTILVATDFSPAALNAAWYAADMARYMNLNLSLLHVCEMPVATELPAPAENIADLFTFGEAGLQELKAEIKKRTAGKLKVSTEIRVGSVMDQLKDYCATIVPYAVVMGTSGSGPVERFLFGSNTVAAMRSLIRPLIVIPPEAKFTNIRRVGLASDFKNISLTIPIDEVKRLIREFHAQLHVLHINEGHGMQRDLTMPDEFRLFRQLFKDFHPVYHLMNNAAIEHGIDDFTRRNDLDLLIIVPKRHNVLDKIFHKSQTKRLALHAHIPIIAMHE